MLELFKTFIPRNSKIPTKAGRQYTTSIDGQVNMKISVFQGERDLVSENRKLAEFDLRGIPSMPAGLPKVDINFILNADGILKVQAIELRSGVKQEVEVKPTYGLTDDEVERMLLDSIANAKEDVEHRKCYALQKIVLDEQGCSEYAFRTVNFPSGHLHSHSPSDIF